MSDLITRLLLLYLVFSNVPTVSSARIHDFPIRDLAVRDARLLPEWRFKPVPAGTTDEDWSGPELRAEREAWRPVTLPAVWDREAGRVEKRTPKQAGWFRTVVDIPSEWNGEVDLCFLAAKYTADVFVDGEYKLTHRGGYTPFRVTLGSAEDLPEQVEMVVRVDNRLSNATVPKGRVGWETYGGIDREVYLLHRPSTRPESLRIRTVQGMDGVWTLEVRADTVGVPESPLDLTLARDGTEVATSRIEDWSTGLEAELTVNRPALWSPEQPNLYTLTFSWGTDQFSFPVGFRELLWKEGHLHVNGRRIWLQGFGQHEAWPGAGHMLTLEQRRRDLRLMKEVFRANALRPGHYPNHPDLYNLADEIGLLVFSEIPVWQNPSHILAQKQVWTDWLEPQLRDMVALIQNHPSAMAWGVLNETGGAHAYVTRARDFLSTLDPERPAAAVLAATHDLKVGGITDLLARNLHYGWYHSRSVYALRQGLEQNLLHSGGKPLWVSELGGLATRGRIGNGYDDDTRGTELYQEKMVRFGLQHVMSHADEVAGISLWTFSDFHPNPHGILDLDRKPKLAAYSVVNLMRPARVVLLLENERSIPSGGEFSVDLKVYSHEPEPGETVTVEWSLQRGRETLKNGSATAELADGWVTDVETIRWTSPADAPPGLLHFHAVLRHANGTVLHRQVLPFEVGRDAGIGILRLSPPDGDSPRKVSVMGMSMTAYPEIGLMLALPSGEVELEWGGKFRTLTIEPGRATEVPWE